MTALPRDRAAIAARLPHGPGMCLLEAVEQASAEHLRCRGLAPGTQAHPLASGGCVAAVHALEYAAQAAAVHGSLADDAAAGAPRAGVIAAVRGLAWDDPWLRGGPLQVDCERLGGDARHCSYRFRVSDETGTQVRGRLTIAFEAGAAA